ncbi:hypothetical protein PIB30_035233 [Stylosanthes scabra]|uniref:Pollen Ole e 1 allergen and extensin family protein n=1 Tax=Stylosanthes scabra TaxID=79078 RepID=A0ABU6TE54_9FABA|nr:hypothetical protein [Stylosanthes scabra]
MAMMMILNGNPFSSSSSSLYLLFIALLLASTGHARVVNIIGQVPCNGGSSSGAAGLNVTLACGQGSNITTVGVSKTGENGEFMIPVNITVGTVSNVLDGNCSVSTGLPIPGCPGFAPTGCLEPVFLKEHS